MRCTEEEKGGVELHLDVAERVMIRNALRSYLTTLKSKGQEAPIPRIMELLDAITPKGFDTKRTKRKEGCKHE